MLEEVLVRSSLGDARGQDPSGGDLEVGGEAQRPMTDVLELDALDQARSRRLGRILALQSLHAGLLVSADDVDPGFVQLLGVGVNVADRSNELVEHLRLFELVPGSHPVATLVRA